MRQIHQFQTFPNGGWNRNFEKKFHASTKILALLSLNFMDCMVSVLKTGMNRRWRACSWHKLARQRKHWWRHRKPWQISCGCDWGRGQGEWCCCRWGWGESLEDVQAIDTTEHKDDCMDNTDVGWRCGWRANKWWLWRVMFVFEVTRVLLLGFCFYWKNVTDSWDLLLAPVGFCFLPPQFLLKDNIEFWITNVV